MTTKLKSQYPSIRSEGALLPTDLLERIAELDSSLPGLSPTDYHLTKNERINEYINRSWARLVPIWASFRQERDDLSASDLGTSLTRQEWISPLFQELGFGQIPLCSAEVIDGKSYAISHRWENIPIHQVSFRLSLDRRADRVAGASRVSPHTLLQEYLNRKSETLWGILTNGLQLRLLRDNVMLTRQAYLEFDLESILDGSSFADFRLLWLVCHASRFETAENPKDCILEKWTQCARESGVRALDHLRDGVTSAIACFGRGFLSHPANLSLREKLKSGALDKQEYYRQLLRLVYRLILLFVTEDRGTLFIPGNPDQQLIADSYGTAHLRELSSRLRGTRHTDRYIALQLLFDQLGSDTGCPELGIPALGGFLFSANAIPDLKDAKITDQALFEGIRAMSLFVEGGVRRAVNYAELDAEELGGIYESLLEMHPKLNSESGIFELKVAAGNERKTTGSYYTPDSLIQSLLDSALEPVIEDRLKACKTPEDQEAALLSLRICDPAAGSGHFLLGAARRIGERLASIRVNGDEPSPSGKRVALRDVIRTCLYGVDINPMSVELCKVSLWMESMEPGLPLSFLDAHIRCGNSLVGMGPGMIVKYLNVPDGAFEAKSGDDKAVASGMKKLNKKEREGNENFVSGKINDFMTYINKLAVENQQLPEDSVSNVREKEKKFHESENTDEFRLDRHIADFWTSAFFLPLTRQTASLHNPTQGALLRLQLGMSDDEGLRKNVNEIAEKNAFFHWSLMFPTIFTGRTDPGFDCILGNPPWDMLQIEEKQFFAEYDPEIALLDGEKRKQAIENLKKTDPTLLQKFETAKHHSDAQNTFVRESSRFNLTANGKLNLYSLFAEINRNLISSKGRTGFIVPSGIVSDDTTKAFFGDLVEKQQISSVFDFENSQPIFEGVHRSYKFCLMTLSGKPVHNADFIFFATNTSQLSDPQRRFNLDPAEIAMFNPNTRTMPIFRTRADARLTEKIYRHVPVLINEQTEENPWKIQFKQGLFNMTSDSGLFFDQPAPGRLRLYEAKYFHHYDHRWSTFEGGSTPRDLTLSEKQDPNFQIRSRYYVAESEVRRRVPAFWKHQWFVAFRNITNVTNERTAIFDIVPFTGIGHSAPLVFIESRRTDLSILLTSCLTTLSFDYCVRQKLGGTNMTYGYLRQFPAIPPSAFSEADIRFIIPRAFELLYTSNDLKPFAEDLWNETDDSMHIRFLQQWQQNHSSLLPPPSSLTKPFSWNPDRRAVLRAELDAYYARLYGLTRDELRYILDPQEVYSPDFPGETFRVLKDNEIKEYGEYRTRRLVLEAWDRFESDGTFAHIPLPEAMPVITQSAVPAKSVPPAADTKPQKTDWDALRKQKQQSRQTHQSPLPDLTPDSGPQQMSLSDYALYKCQECGKLVMGYARPDHEKSNHKGRSVEWKKMETKPEI